MSRTKRFARTFALIVGLGALSCVGVLFLQGQQRPKPGAEYVALGSSFAAGLGLGQRVDGSPIVCQRSVNGYPRQLARTAGLKLVDVTCSGATIQHVLRGGQVFLGPQVDAVGSETRVVTVTGGGNDIGYVGDLTAMAYRQGGGLLGLTVGLFWGGAAPADERNFAALQTDLLATYRQVRRLAPRARILAVTYPTILPSKGTCRQLGIDEAGAERMQQVGLRLAEVTREAARQAGVDVIDMDRLSIGHDACSSEPWVNGAAPALGAPFHPTLAGARATAAEVKRALEQAG